MEAKREFLYVLILIALAIALASGHDILFPSQAFDSPLPTPPLPTPNPVPAPKCHVRAIAYVAREYGISADRLLAGSCTLNWDDRWACDSKEEWFEFPFIQRKACYVKVIVIDSDQTYGIAVDEQGQIVNLEELRAQERAAAGIQCGKLHPALCDRLPTMGEDELVDVSIWLTHIDMAPLWDKVAARYPPELQPVKGREFEGDHPDFERAFREVEQLMAEAYQERERPLIAFLEAQGFSASLASTTAPIVNADLPKDIIIALAARDDVNIIYLAEGHFDASMDPVGQPAGSPRSAPATGRRTSTVYSSQSDGGLPTTNVK